MGASARADVDEVEAFLDSMVRPPRRDPPRIATPLQGSQLHQVPTPYGEVAAWRVGDGPAVLLVHGWQDDNSLWEPVIEALVVRGRAVAVFDLPAHGLSSGDSGLGWEAAAAAVAVASTLAPVDAVVGHSIGALAAIVALYRRQLEVERAVLIGAPLVAVDRWLRKAEQDGVPLEVAERARARYAERVPPARDPFDAAGELRRLDLPVLAVNGVDDERAPFSDARDALDGHPDAQLVAVEGLGHRRQARDPAVIEQMVGFLTH